MRRANVRQIEAFNAFMTSGSVTKAAEALFVTQPAVSKLLRLFEDACGITLFNRQTGKLIPTPEARLLYAETEKLEAGILRVHKVACEISEFNRGHVAIVGFPGISLQLIPRVVASILGGRSGVRVSLLTRTSRSIEDAMLTRTADFGISLVPSTNPMLRCEFFSPISMICALPADHKLSQKKAVSLNDLCDEPFIALGRDDLSYPTIRNAFHAKGLAAKEIAEVQMLEAACSMVSEGYGVSIVPTLATVGPRDPGVVFRPLEQRIETTSWLITSKLIEQPRLAYEIITRTRDALRQLDRETAHSDDYR